MVGKETEKNKKSHDGIRGHNDGNASEVGNDGNGGSKDDPSKMGWWSEEVSSKEVAKDSEG